MLLFLMKIHRRYISLYFYRSNLYRDDNNLYVDNV